MKPITYFRVKPWKYVSKIACGNLCNRYMQHKDDYYKVVVFNSYEDMYKYADKHFQQGIMEHDYAAICKYLTYCHFEDGELVDVDKCCGWILFYKEQLGVGTVIHESTHAINYYFQYRIKNCYEIFKKKEYDELYAYMMGSITRQIYNKLYDKKVI